MGARRLRVVLQHALQHLDRVAGFPACHQQTGLVKASCPILGVLRQQLFHKPLGLIRLLGVQVVFDDFLTRHGGIDGACLLVRGKGFVALPHDHVEIAQCQLWFLVGRFERGPSLIGRFGLGPFMNDLVETAKLQMQHVALGLDVKRLLILRLGVIQFPGHETQVSQGQMRIDRIWVCRHRLAKDGIRRHGVILPHVGRREVKVGSDLFRILLDRFLKARNGVALLFLYEARALDIGRGRQDRIDAACAQQQ